MVSLPAFFQSFLRSMDMFGSSTVGLMTHLLFWLVVILIIIQIMKEIWN